MKMRVFSFFFVKILVLVFLFSFPLRAFAGSELTPDPPVQNPYILFAERFLGAITQLGTDAQSLSGSIDGARNEVQAFGETYLSSGSLLRMGITLGVGVGLGLVCTGVACYSCYKVWQHKEFLILRSRETGRNLVTTLGCGLAARSRAETEEPLAQDIETGEQS